MPLPPVRRALRAGLFSLVLLPAAALAQEKPSGTTEVILAGAPAARDSAAVDSAAASTASIPLQRPAIFSRRDAVIGGTATVAAVALFPFDQRITNWLRDPARLESSAWKNTMDGAEWGVEKGSLMLGAGLWAAGLVTRNRGIAETGMHSLVSVATTLQVTKVLKGTFGRSRPYQSADSLPHDWDFGSGFNSERRSFPSGHTSHAFAFATAMSHEVSHHWPSAGKVVTPLLFAGATAAAAARVYNDKHWASDVTLGAGVGILTTRATLAYLHGRPTNWLDRVALNTRIVPRRDGATVAVTLPVR